MSAQESVPIIEGNFRPCERDIFTNHPCRDLPIPAKLIGALAVHGGGGYFRISHIATGRAVVDYEGPEHEAIAVARRLQEMADWTFRTVTEYRRRPELHKAQCDVIDTVPGAKIPVGSVEIPV